MRFVSSKHPDSITHLFQVLSHAIACARQIAYRVPESFKFETDGFQTGNRLEQNRRDMRVIDLDAAGTVMRLPDFRIGDNLGGVRFLRGRDGEGKLRPFADGL